MKMNFRNFGVILLIVAFLFTLGQLGYAREASAGGVFFDLPGSLADSGVMPMKRLVLGNGFTVAHLDLLFGLPSVAIPNPGVRFLPYIVFNFPIKINKAAILTPYSGVAPVLFSTGALASPPLADWIFKFGASFTFAGFGFYMETGFFVPIAALPAFSLGFMVDFESLGNLVCHTCGGKPDDEYY